MPSTPFTDRPSLIAPNPLPETTTERIGPIRGHRFIPPSSYVLLSCIAVQLGIALAKSLYDSLGSLGAVFLSKSLGAVLLLLLFRPRWQAHSSRDYGLIGVYGLVMTVGNFAFYAAIDRIPLGVAATLEFLGPLGVALLGSRRWLDLLWVGLAAGGVLLLNPLTSTSLDLVGVGLALLAALSWASYILLAGPVGRVFPGGSGLAIGMGITSLLLMPTGVASGGMALFDPGVLLLGLLVGTLNTVVPYSLEFAALKRVPPRIFGILISIEPAIAAIVGFLILGEQLNVKTFIAIVLVSSAAMGASWFGRQNPHI